MNTDSSTDDLLSLFDGIGDDIADDIEEIPNEFGLIDEADKTRQVQALPALIMESRESTKTAPTTLKDWTEVQATVDEDGWIKVKAADFDLKAGDEVNILLRKHTKSDDQ